MKHKLSGYAIKGDGTQETAERIRKVFEADGWETHTWIYRSIHDAYYGNERTGEVDWDVCRGQKITPLTEAEDLVYGDQIIPDEAERIVFGDELKVGMKVVFTDEARKDYGHAWSDDKIYEIEGFEPCCEVELLKLKERCDTINPYHFRRATITDFLRTLPADIAERALSQVDEDWGGYKLYTESLTQSLLFFCDWAETSEGDEYWNCVKNGEYDRARAILAEKDRVGKWWKCNDGMFRSTAINGNGDLYGYGVNSHGNWFDRTDTLEHLMVCPSEDLHNLTPATPEEVEVMLGSELNKKYPVGTKFKCVFSGKTFRRHQQSHYNINKKDWSAHIDGFSVLENGKWAEIITPAPEKPKYEVGDWVCNNNYPMCFGQVTKIDGEKVYYDGYDLMKNIRHMTTEEIAAVTNKPQPQPSEFPRVMWVWDDGMDGYEHVNIVRHDPNDPKDTSYPWKASCGTGFMYASDTHPVTGEPAVKKDVVEQIREVVECELTPEIDMVRQIKEILKNEK